MLDQLMREAATRGVLCKKVFLEISQNSRENTCEFSEISKNTFLTEHFRTTASSFSLHNTNTFYLSNTVHFTTVKSSNLLRLVQFSRVASDISTFALVLWGSLKLLAKRNFQFFTLSFFLFFPFNQETKKK